MEIILPSDLASLISGLQLFIPIILLQGSDDFIHHLFSNFLSIYRCMQTVW